MRRGTAIALRDHIRFSHIEKSLDGRLTALRVNNNTTLCCIYAPSGTVQRAERERFFNGTLAYYLRHNTEHTILSGDFNSVIRQCDATGYNASPALQATIQQLQLHDAWVKLHPRDAGYTYVTYNSSSRLDRIYISTGLCDQLRNAHTHVCSFSDHKALVARIVLPSLGRAPGRGYWSLRPNLLTAENVDELRYQWQYWTRQRRNYASWITWWISYAKPKIKSFFKWKNRLAYDEFHNQHQRLYAQLRQAYDAYHGQPHQITTINRVKAEMLTLQRRFTENFVRINATYVAGEPLSTFQLGERKRKRTTITQLRTGTHSLNNSAEIEQHLFEYYRDLYARQATEEGARDEFACDRIIPENDAANEACASEITTAEIQTAIQTSAKRRSPGSDGIPIEFFSKCWDFIHREMNLILNEARTGNFPAEFANGVIVLVKKSGGDGTARSYRPISLLNVDFKILSRILKTRLEAVMKAHHILTDSQKCSNAGRNIFQATLALKDRIAQMKTHRQVGKLISFDLQQAFDLVNRDFLFHTMRSLGISQQLIELLVRIAAVSSSRLLVNGQLSPSFPIERSVRQGDPLSMHLFTLYLHPLLRRLEMVCGADLVVAYADDVSVIATSPQQIHTMRKLFCRFGRASGAMLNERKTVAIDVGFIEQRRIDVAWLRTEMKIKILGIFFTNSIRAMVKINWDALVSKFAQQVWLHSLRTLTLQQKVILLNTFLLSKIWYAASILLPSCVHSSKITATMGTFLWRGIAARVPMLQLARDKDQGGLKLHLPALKCKSLLLNRQIQEIGSTPYYQSFLHQANPNPVIPADFPCLKMLTQQYPLLPPQIQQNPSSDQIHRYFVDQTERPKVERDQPAVDWRRVWRNISARQLTSEQRTTLYLFVNNKTQHRRLLFLMRRSDTENCLHCGVAVETLKHKFSECQRVAEAWSLLQRKISTTMNGWRRLSFEDLHRPIFANIDRNRKIRILKLLNIYINHINQLNGRIDVDALEFELDSGS